MMCLSKLHQCWKAQCSTATHVAESRVPSPPMPVLFEFLLLQVSESTVLWCSTHSRDWSSFSSSFNFIGVPSSPVSILSELLLLWSQFYHSSFFSTVNFIGVPSAPSVREYSALLLHT